MDKNTDILGQLDARFNKRVMVSRGSNAEVAFAKIDPNYTSGNPYVIFDKDRTGALSGKSYPVLSGYTPVAGDKVALLGSNDEWVIIGKVASL